MKHYQHLSKEERFYIWNVLRTGSPQLDIAKMLDRSPSQPSAERSLTAATS